VSEILLDTVLTVYNVSIYCLCCHFCSDGVIRLFTASAERVASADKLAEYEQLIAASEIPAQIGDIKTDDLVGPSALQVPGNHIHITGFVWFWSYWQPKLTNPPIPKS